MQLNSNISISKAGADIKLEDFLIHPEVAMVFQVFYTIQVETKTDMITEPVHFTNFVYIPRIKQNFLNQDDINDEFLNEEVSLNEKQQSLFGEVTYLHRRKDGRPVNVVL